MTAKIYPYIPTKEDIEKYGSDLSKHPKVICMALNKYEKGDIVKIDIGLKK